FHRVLSGHVNGAVLQADGSVAISSASPVPLLILRFARRFASVTRLDTVGPRGDDLRVITTPFVQSGHRIGQVVLWESRDAIEDLYALTHVAFAITIPLIAGLAIVGGNLVAKRGLMPLREIAALASDIEAHDLSSRLEMRDPNDELSRLGATFDRMLDRLEAAFERQRQFTADASHELRAPLSIIRAEAELALRREHSAAEYRQGLQSIAAETDRLERLIADLLTLARADDVHPASGRADLCQLSAEAAMRLTPLTLKKSVSIHQISCSQAWVKGDALELGRVAFALLHNAVKYAPAGGTVTFAVQSADGRVRLIVNDDGPGFSSEGLRHATERFWRDRDRGGRDGTGLGLAIVAHIVRKYGGTLELQNSTAGGAEVVVEFSAAS
ncbi:MAG: HAMP domain-containing histidine kinase, partial [Candidatus Eremiobacteraeota bacterium]|nr:HAMP domain-containing histidine kinase [Candidatus Eremiobacteraeota bacterium]